MSKHAQSIDSQILKRILRKGMGYVFTPADFLDLGPRNAIDLALSRSVRAGTIRKLARGLYDYPRQDPRLGLLSAGTDDIANALETAIRRRSPRGFEAINLEAMEAGHRLGAEAE